MAMTSQKFKLIQEHRVILYQIQLSGQPVVNPSPHVFLSYGDSPPIKPVGETELFCMHGNRSVALKFQIIPDTVMSSKPALLFGCDNERLGLLRVSSNVHSIGLNENDHGQAKIPDPAPLPLINASFIGTYEPQFQGRGCLGPPVHFQFKPGSQPAQAPVHRVPLSKRQKEYETIQQYVKESVLTKVWEPTPWCSN